MNLSQVEQLLGPLQPLCGKEVEVDTFTSTTRCELVGFTCDEYGDISACVKEPGSFLLTQVHPTRIRVQGCAWTWERSC